MRKYLLSLALLLAVAIGFPALADFPGTSVTQTATRLDAAQGWWGQANGVTSCNSVSATAANDTITITPPSTIKPPSASASTPCGWLMIWIIAAPKTSM